MMGIKTPKGQYTKSLILYTAFFCLKLRKLGVRVFKTTELREIEQTDSDWALIVALLENQKIKLDPSVTKTYGYYESDQLIATASVLENTLRSIAVDASKQGSNALAELLDEIMSLLYDSGYDNFFIYTTPRAAESFKHLGFYEIASTSDVHNTSVILLEKKPNGIHSYMKHLKHFKTSVNDVGVIVMNANPFTKGHQYLIEYACKQCTFLYVLVVSSEKSSFPFQVRFDLIVEGTAHLDNVYVLKGGDYLISQVTFPSYFLKQSDDTVRIQANLDLTIFGKYFVKALNITKRFVGNEPYCETTAIYNTQMKKVLPQYGVEVIEIPRKEADGQAISASRVRQYLAESDWMLLEKIVPKTTFDFLKSSKAKSIIEQIKQSKSRH